MLDEAAGHLKARLAVHDVDSTGAREGNHGEDEEELAAEGKDPADR
jgi:hypothetical protein